MAQLKQLEFVKSSALTEMAYAVVNTVWPDIENYFDAVGFDQWVDKYTMQDSFVDVWSCRMPSCNGIIFGNRRHAPSDSHPLVMRLFLPVHVNVPNVFRQAASPLSF